jgi:adenosylcobyric acid synthase
VVVRRGDAAPGDGTGGEGAIAGSVGGTLVHGLFENAPVRAALGAVAAGEPLGDPYDVLADHFAAALDLAHLDRMVGL